MACHAFRTHQRPFCFPRFYDLLDVHVIVYLDNILIFSDNPADHKKHVHEVLRQLRLHGLYVRPDKCFFAVDSVNYLGFILSRDGLKMDPGKVQAITDWPEPRKVKDIQSFLGLQISIDISFLTIPLLSSRSPD